KSPVVCSFKLCPGKKHGPLFALAVGPSSGDRIWGFDPLVGSLSPCYGDEVFPFCRRGHGIPGWFGSGSSVDASLGRFDSPWGWALGLRFMDLRPVAEKNTRFFMGRDGMGDS